MQYCISHKRNVSVWMANDSNTRRLISNEILFLSIIKSSGCLNSIKILSFKISQNVFKGFLLCNVIYCSPFIEITYHNNYKHTEGMTTYVFPF